MKLIVVLALAAVAVPTTVVLVDGGGESAAQETIDRMPVNVPRELAGPPVGGEAPRHEGEVRALPSPPAARFAIGKGAFPPRQDESAGHVIPSASLSQLIADLRDDDVRWNATSAASELARRVREDSPQRGEIRAALEPHVTSEDAQLRTLACSLLIDLDLHEIEEGRRTPASPALLDEVTTWLTSLPRLETRFFNTTSYYRSVLFAMEHIDEIEGRLVDAVSRPAGRDVFTHAFVLGATGRARQTGLVVPLLVEHLRDNYRSDDACMATEALIGLGRAALPWFEAELDTGDSQQRRALEAIILEVTDPTVSLEQAEARERSPRLSTKYHVPARSWRFRTSYKRYDRTEGL